MRLVLATAALLLGATMAHSQTIYPIDRAEILTGAKFDFKVEFAGRLAPDQVKVTINGADYAATFGKDTGLKELVTIGKIWELAQLDRKVKSGRKYDTVIVDAPATGHGVGFLQTPRTFANIARVGPIHSQAQTLDNFITDHENTGVAIVALPEEMPVNESAALEHDLVEEVGVAVDRVYLNGLYPERFSKEEAERLSALAAADDGAPKAAARAALSEFGRARSQRAQLARLRRRAQAPVKTLPFLFEPDLGPEAARRLSRRLA